MRNLVLASVHTDGTVLHTVPEGNSHSLCGRIAVNTVDIWEVAPLVTAGKRRLCKSCAKVTPARDTRRPVDPFLSEPTDIWSVTNKADVEITRVCATTMEGARNEALQVVEVREVDYAENGFSLRRLRMKELTGRR